MGKMQRDKGARVEREIANFLGGKRIPLSGMTSNVKGDIEAYGMKFEVKAKKDGFKMIYSYLEKDNMDAAIIKADRKEALVILPISKFKELMDRLNVLEDFVEENSVETIEKKMEPYYEELAKILNIEGE
ncbi:hypothetical protein ACFYKX_26490 [Cytobacillus sp. FJAT-54145]|uniref:Uncharacterized protein n=1 Tax=Cytobacillus spartinae TaxID=3299023 RepID=A0ABW6KIQ2_9BACI